MAVAIAWIIFAGLTHFNAARAFDFPAGAFHLSSEFFTGMGAAMLIATYDYWGYYNVCFLGGEVKDPGRTIPRALILSIVAVAAIYIVMNISVLGVVPWRDMVTHTGEQNNYIVSVFMERIYGNWAGRAIAAADHLDGVRLGVLAAAGLLARAVRSGARWQLLSRSSPACIPKSAFPRYRCSRLGAVAIVFCLLRLADVIAALVVIRILLQFIVQAVGVMVLRHRRPDMPRPFRMWLYPLPALMAIVGFVYILLARKNFQREIKYALVILIVGLLVYFLRACRRREWPFTNGSDTVEVAR